MCKADEILLWRESEFVASGFYWLKVNCLSGKIKAGTPSPSTAMSERRENLYQQTELVGYKIWMSRFAPESLRPRRLSGGKQFLF